MISFVLLCVNNYKQTFMQLSDRTCAGYCPSCQQDEIGAIIYKALPKQATDQEIETEIEEHLEVLSECMDCAGEVMFSVMEGER